MTSLDPKIWANLPHDIICIVIEWLDVPSQKNWAIVSREFYSTATKRIWQHLRLPGRAIEVYAMRALFDTKALTPNNRTDGIVHFLTHQAHRPSNKRMLNRIRSPNALAYKKRRVAFYPRLTTIIDLKMALPSSYVKTLWITNMEDRCSLDRVEFVLPQLLRCLPQVIDFTFDGLLTQSLLVPIVLVQNMKSLALRSRNYCTRDPHSCPVYDTVDFGVLAILRNLRTLDVGQMKHREAGSLAKAVSCLQLDRLEIVCFGCLLSLGGAWPTIKEHQEAESPLIPFLQTLGEVSEGFPCTLRRIVLIDVFYTQIPCLWYLLATTVQPCKLLKLLGSTIVMPRKAVKALSDLGLRSTGNSIVINDCERLISDQTFRTLYSYRKPSSSQYWRTTLPLPEADEEFPKSICKTLDKIGAETYPSIEFECPNFTFMLMKFSSPNTIIIRPEAPYRSWAEQISEPDEEMSKLIRAFKIMSIIREPIARVRKRSLSGSSLNARSQPKRPRQH